MKRFMHSGMVILMVLVALFVSEHTQAAEKEYDVVVYGGTSAGVAVAVQVSRMGKSVIIVSPDKHLGGLSSGGLGWTDSGNKSVIGGLAREFYQRVKKHYDKPSAWKFQKPEQYSRYRASDDAMWVFEPRVAEAVFEQLVKENKIPVHCDEWLDRSGKGVSIQGGDFPRIQSIRTLSGKTYHGKMFFDATYEGDLLDEAGVDFHVGREANSKYGETINGIQKARARSHQFTNKISPYVKPGDPSSGLLPRVHAEDPGNDGDGDHRMQAYTYRLCMTNVPANRVSFPKPKGYDVLQYELLLRDLLAGSRHVFGKIDPAPNGKTDTNNHGSFSTDNIGMNYDYPEGSYKRREEILAEHRLYQQGYHYFLCNDPRVPESVRSRYSKWGLAKDEFTDSDNWPHQIYVREARRMVSDFVMTELHLRKTKPTPKPIGMGSYNMDSHNVQRYVAMDKDGNAYVRNEGDIQISPGGAYPISYEAIIPKKSQCANLIVPVCLSSSHIAYGSIRMEPVFMLLGQSGATAAVLAIDSGVAVQDVDYEKLAAKLTKDGQVLAYTGPKRSGGNSQGIDPAKLPGIVVDDVNGKRENQWLESKSIGGFIGKWYLHDNNENKGGRSVTFMVNVEKPGAYDVRIAYTANNNRASNVPVTIESADGKVVKTVNQRKAPSDGAWASLGVFKFIAGKASIVISNKGTDGHVIVDAVQLLPAKEKGGANGDAGAKGKAKAAPKKKPTGPERWESTIKKFEAADKVKPPKEGGVLFVGSSSIRMWKLDKWFPDFNAINRGFGGSEVADSLYYADRIVLKYKPRIIFIYAGDNDIAKGKTPKRVFDDFKKFVAKVHGELPETKIAFIAIKPSIARWKLVGKMREANKLVADYAKEHVLLSFVDIDTPMIGDDGKPMKDLFLNDGLHMSEKGYEIWTALVKKLLK